MEVTLEWAGSDSHFQLRIHHQLLHQKEQTFLKYILCSVDQFS
jgi:hypothetical protein